MKRLTYIALAMFTLLTFVQCDDSTESVGSSIVPEKDIITARTDTMYATSRTITANDSILANTNEMLKNNVPGMFENTYMTTSTFARPSIKYMKYKGLDFAEVRGFWEVYNDFMGGPFVSHVFYSKDGQDMIGLQGSVYAPKYDKRQYMRQVESIIYSFEWAKDETEE